MRNHFFAGQLYIFYSTVVTVYIYTNYRIIIFFAIWWQIPMVPGGDVYKQIKNCKVKLRNILEFNDSEPHCSITSRNSKHCKTCKRLIKETQFTNGLTNKTYHTRSWGDLNCKSSNVVYGVEYSLCGLIYVGETKGQLRNRMSGHRYEINHGSNQLLYKHFSLPYHSILSFKVRILEKIYHPTNNPSLSTPLRRQREEFWIRELGTAAPYGCNDKIDSVGNLTSPRSSSVNVMRLFGRVMDIGTTIVLIFMLMSHLTVFFHMYSSHNHIRTKLYQLPVTKLRSFQKEVVDTKTYVQNSPEYKLVAIILDVAKFRWQKVCDALVYLLDNIFIRFGTKLYRQTIGIPMGTNCAPLVADLFLFCYERDFMKSLSRESQADILRLSIQLQDTLMIY